MENHLEISFKKQFWIRNVRNLTQNRNFPPQIPPSFTQHLKIKMCPDCLFSLCSKFRNCVKIYFLIIFKMVFRFLDAKPCRIIVELRQKSCLDPTRDECSKMSRFGPVRICQGLSKTFPGRQVLVSRVAFPLFFCQKLRLSCF